MPMYKRLFSGLLLIASVFQTGIGFSQKSLSKVHVVKDNVACLYGFKNDSGRWVIPAQFNSIGKQSWGYTIVVKNEKYGAVDIFGKPVIPLQYDYLEFFETGVHWGVWSNYLSDSLNYHYFIATKRNSRGIINFKNKVIVPFIYKEIEFLWDFDKELAIIKLTTVSELCGLVKIVNNQSKTILAPIYKDIESFHYGFSRIQAQNNLYGFISIYGNIIAPQYTGGGFGKDDYNDELMAVVYKNKKCGMIDTNGKIRIPIEYNYINTNFNDYELAVIKKGNKYGLRNKKGIVVKAQYDWVDEYDSNHFIVRNDKTFGVINRTGNYTVNPTYESIAPLSAKAVWFFKEGRIGIINKLTGQIILKDTLDEYKKYNDKYTIIKAQGKVGVIHNSGQIIISPEYDDYGWCGYDNEIYLIKDKRWILFNLEKKEIANNRHSSLQVSVISRDYYNWESGRKDNGLIEKNGTVILPQKYFIRPLILNSGRFLTIEDSNYREALYGINGELIIDFGSNKIQECGHQLCLMTKDGKVGIINNRGKILINPEFLAVTNYWDGFAWVLPDSLGNRFAGACLAKWGLVDSGSHYVLPPIYDFPATFYNGQGVTSINQKFGIIKRNGEIVLPFEYDGIDYGEYNSYWINKGGKQGIASKQGQILLEPLYDRIEWLSNGLAIIKIGDKEGLCDSTGKIILEPKPEGLVNYKSELAFFGHPHDTLQFPDEPRYARQLKNNIFYDKITDFKNPERQRKINNRIISEIAKYSDSYYSSGCNYDAYPRGHSTYTGSEYNYYYHLLDVTDFSFCNVQEEYKPYQYDMYQERSTFTFKNFLLYKDKFMQINLDSLFEKEYKVSLYKIYLRIIQTDETLKLDCSNPAVYLKFLEDRFSLTEKGINVYLEYNHTYINTEDEESEDIKITIPYTQLKTIARKEGIIEYLIKQKK